MHICTNTIYTQTQHTRADILTRQPKSQDTSTMTTTNNITTPMAGTTQNHVGSQISQDDAPVHKIEETSKSEGTQAGGTLQHTNVMQSKSISTGTGTRTKDYNNDMVRVLNVTIICWLICTSKQLKCFLPFFFLFVSFDF